MNDNRQFSVTYFDVGLRTVTVQASDMLNAIHILQRENIRATQLVSIRETPTADTLSGLQKAIE